MRNMSKEDGLVNGTLIKILDLLPTVIKVEILIGEHRGNVQFIPRITLISEDDEAGLLKASIPFGALICSINQLISGLYLEAMRYLLYLPKRCIRSWSIV
ncbi:hypothetical protein MP228_000571 [Amoeboaphelidium protococcarum]|nr:hypothetical protein MP228_000571 [Amoeboaphelidium protococcarum]